MRKTLFFCFVMVFLGLCLPRSVFAQGHEHGPFELTLANQTEDTIKVAWVFQNTLQKDWVSEGWLELKPGQSEVLELEGACPPTVGVYAKTEDGAVLIEGSDPKFVALLEPGKPFVFSLKRIVTSSTAKILPFYRLGVHHSSLAYKYVFK